MYPSGSPHRAEVEALRRRAAELLELAGEAPRMGNYDVSCFLAEQAVQLHLKSVLLERVGDYPRTHSIRTLLSEISKIIEDEKVKELSQKNGARLIALEDAYIIAKYTPTTYTKDDAEDLFSLAKEIIVPTSEVQQR